MIAQQSEQELEKVLTILHFNDVYDIEPNQYGQHGFVNFIASFDKLKEQYPNSLVVFSGDAFAPSKLSKVKKGRQMVHCLKHLKIDVACYGNHEFDYPLAHTIELAQSCQFPWLLANVKNKQTGSNLGNGLEYLIIEKDGFVIGFMGLAGPDFKGRLISQYKNIAIYENHIECARRICTILRKKGCNLIIAMTHMRIPPDEQLAKNVPEIDLILGGHDHIVFYKEINKIPVIKSGKNFQHIGICEITNQKKKKKNGIMGRRWSFLYQALEVKKTVKKYPLLEEYILNVIKQWKQRGITKPKTQKQKPKKQNIQNKWKFNHNFLNGKTTLSISSTQRSQIAFAKFVCFKKGYFYDPTLYQISGQTSENYIVQQIFHICQVVMTISKERGQVLYGSGLNLVPYLVQTCNLIYLPNQIQCCFSSIEQLQLILKNALKSNISCYAIIEESFIYKNKKGQQKMNATIKLSRIPEMYLNILKMKEIKRLFYLDLNISGDNVLNRQGQISSVKQLQQNYKIYIQTSINNKKYYVDLQQLKINEDLLIQKQKDHKAVLFDFKSQNNSLRNLINVIKKFNKYINDRIQHLKPKQFQQQKLQISQTINKQDQMSVVQIKFNNITNSQRQFINSFVAYNISKQFINKNNVELEDQQYFRGIVFNEGQISNPTYQLGYKYLPILFEIYEQESQSKVLNLLTNEQLLLKRWFNLNQPNYEITSQQNKIYQLFQKSDKKTTTTLKNSKGKQKTLEWVTKYAMKSYAKLKYLHSELLIQIFKQLRNLLIKQNE